VKKRALRYLLLLYAVLSSVFLGGFIGFLIIYPFLQVLFDRLGIHYSVDDPPWVNYMIYAMVLVSIAVCMMINRRRYLKHIRQKGLV
jgi:ABC-type phosphate transport system permease subunit